MKSHHYFTELSDCGKAQPGMVWLCLHLLVASHAVPRVVSFLQSVRKVLLCELRDQTRLNPNIPLLSNSKPFSSPVQVCAPAPFVGQPQGREGAMSVYSSALSSLQPPLQLVLFQFPVSYSRQE